MQDENLNDQISNTKEEDNGAKLIFENSTLCAELLRDYSDIELLKNVMPEDITDVTERFIPMFTEERNADVIKQVRIGMGEGNDDNYIFIALIEHKAHVDYNVIMQVLRYMVFIWEDYEKRQEKKFKGVSKLKSFKYPPIFPIVYYNGEEKWTAAMSLRERIALSEIFGMYIPDFCYHLVSTSEYDNEALISKNDGLSLIMLINKIKEADSFKRLGLPKYYLDDVANNSPEDVLEVLARVIAVILRKQNVPENEIQNFIDHIKERRMSDLFEGWKGFDVQEERRNGEFINQIKLICKKLSKGKNIDDIASELEEDDISKIQEIVDIAYKFAPDYDANKIYEELTQKNQTEVIK